MRFLHSTRGLINPANIERIYHRTDAGGQRIAFAELAQGADAELLICEDDDILAAEPIPNQNPRLELMYGYGDGDDFCTDQVPVVAWRVGPSMQVYDPVTFVDMDSARDWLIVDTETGRWWNTFTGDCGETLQGAREFLKRRCEVTAQRLKSVAAQ